MTDPSPATPTSSAATVARGRVGWRPEPLALVATLACAVAGASVYVESEQLVASGARLGLYALVPVGPLALLLIVGIIRRENAVLVRYGVPLAGAGLVMALIHTVLAWGSAGPSELCGPGNSCFDGVGSPFLSLSWLDWLAVASYFAVIAAAATTADPTFPA